MKTQNLFKALVIAVPILVAVYASYCDHKKQKDMVENYKSELVTELSANLTK